MDVNAIVQVINGCGFPIAMSLGLLWLLYDTNNKNREMTQRTNDAINNNTAVLSRLLEREENN